ncbi:MAG TPA: hypothetical protein DCS93_07060 [Microscillaceae bacterium]|nr:hypothetical protein [Microscillaceae bacterium]
MLSTVNIQKILITLLCLGIFVQQSQAQDATFSQFYTNKLRFNPAYAGSFLGTRVNFNWRRQWPAVSGKIENINFSIDQSLPHIGGISGGWGLMINKDVEGEGLLTTQEAALAGSLMIRLDNPKDKTKKFLFFGLQTSLFWQDIDWDQLVFSNQIDPILPGIQGASGVPQPIAPEQRMFPDIGAGAFLWLQRDYINNRESGAKNWQHYKDWVATVGVSAKHLMRPNESFWRQQVSDTLKMPIRWTIHGMGVFPLPTPYVALAPAFMFEKQRNINTINVGLLGIFTNEYSENTSQQLSRRISTQFLGGVLARGNGDGLHTIILNAGCKIFKQKRIRKKNWNRSPSNTIRQTSYQLSYSYDLISSASQLVGSTAGAHEVTFIMTFGAAEKVRCPKNHLSYYSNFWKRKRMMVLY